MGCTEVPHNYYEWASDVQSHSDCTIRESKGSDWCSCNLHKGVAVSAWMVSAWMVAAWMVSACMVLLYREMELFEFNVQKYQIDVESCSTNL